MNKNFEIRLVAFVESNKNKILKMVQSSFNNKDITMKQMTEEKSYQEKCLEVIYVLLPYKLRTQMKKQEFIDNKELIPVMLKD